MAGLQVTSSNTMGGSNNVILRGVKSLTQSNQALFVVDGVPDDNTNQARSSYCNLLQELVVIKKKTRHQQDTVVLLTLLIEKWDEEHNTFSMQTLSNCCIT